MLTRSNRWPLLVAVLAGGLAVGRYSGQPAAQGQATPPTVPAIPTELTSYRNIVKEVLPAVVSIETKSKPKKQEAATAGRQRTQPNSPEIPEELRRFFGQMPGMDEMSPRQQQSHAFGSGFIVEKSGVIVTNYHVVEGADEVEVTLTDGQKFTSSDIKTDSATDLAIVRIKANGELPFLRFGDSGKMEIGDRVLAVGAPFGLAGSVTQGIVSAKGRGLGLNRYEDFLQTDAAINPGNSGGPLVNLAGEVIGVNSVIKSRSGGFQGVGLAITSNMARNVMQQLETNGTVKRGYLGIEMVREVSPDVASRLGMKNGKGVVVARVLANSPAATAGIKSDDVITAVNGQPTNDNRMLLNTVGSLPIGKSVQVTVLRDGQSENLSLTLKEQPKGFTERTAQPRTPAGEGTVSVEKFGLNLSDLPADRAESYGVKGGALVADVDPNGVAAEAGFSRGQVITKVNRQDVSNAEDAKKALEKGDAAKGVLVHVRSADGGTAIVLLKTEKK